MMLVTYEVFEKKQQAQTETEEGQDRSLYSFTIILGFIVFDTCFVQNDPSAFCFFWFFIDVLLTSEVLFNSFQKLIVWQAANIKHKAKWKETSD